MSSENESLHERVAACRHRLSTEPLADDLRRDLLLVLTELDEQFTRSASSSNLAVADRPHSPVESPLERLRNFERSVEVSHPVLCGLVGNLADSLSRLGI